MCAVWSASMKIVGAGIKGCTHAPSARDGWCPTEVMQEGAIACASLTKLW